MRAAYGMEVKKSQPQKKKGVYFNLLPLKDCHFYYILNYVKQDNTD